MSRKNFAKSHGRAVLPGQMWATDNGFTSIRVMAVSEGYIMARKHGATPFVMTIKDLDAGWDILSIPQPTSTTSSEASK